MNVVRFPPVEPWPTETFADYGIQDLEALIDGAHAEIVKRRTAAADADTCADCGEYVHPSESICGACGAPRSPKNTTGPARDHLGVDSEQGQEVTMVPLVQGCTCGGRGLCTACVLESYEPEIAAVNQAHDTLEAALARKPASLRSVKA